MTDRLAEIKERWQEMHRGDKLLGFDLDPWQRCLADDINWLIAEVDRLRNEVSESARSISYWRDIVMGVETLMPDTIEQLHEARRIRKRYESEGT